MKVKTRKIANGEDVLLQEILWRIGNAYI